MGRDTPYSEALEDLEADIGRRVMSGDDDGLTDEALAKRWEQYRKGKDLAYYPSRTLELLHQEERLVRGVMGPVGCLAGECRIWTEFGLERMDELYRRGEPFRVWSRRKDGTVGLEWATAPFIKGREPLMKVELEEGSFRGAAAHYVQRVDLAWIPLRLLRSGDRLLSTGGTCSRAFEQDVLRLSSRGADFPGNCSACFRQCDEQPRFSVEGAPVLPPSQDDARGDNECGRGSRTPRAPQRSGILSGIAAWLRPMRGSLYRYFGAWGGPEHDEPDRTVCECGGCTAHHSEQRSSQGEDRQCTDQPYVERFLSTRDELGHLPGVSDSTSWASFGCVGVSVPSDRPEVYYDLTVPSTGTYIGEWGIVHHNSGKTTGVVADMNMRHLRQRVCRDGIVRDRFALVRGTLALLNATLVDTWVRMFPKTRTFGSKYGVCGDLTRIRNGVTHVLEIRGFGLDKQGALNNLLSNNFSGAIINEAVTISEAAKDGVVGRLGRYPDPQDAPSGFENMPGAWQDQDGYWRWFLNHGVSMDTNAASEDTWWYKKARDGMADPEMEVYMDQPPAAFKIWDDDLERWKYELNTGQRPGVPPAENIEHLLEHWDYYRKILKTSSSAHIARFVLCEYSKTEVGTPVFGDFSDRWHVAKGGVPWPPQGTRLFGGMDFGQTRRAVLAYMSPEGRLMVFAEAIDATGSVETFANNVLRPMLGEHGFSVSDLTIYCDPAGMNRSEHSDMGGIYLMRACGFDAVPPAKLINNDTLTRLESVRHFLTRIIGSKGAVQIDPSCVNLIRSIGGGYVWGRRKIGAEYMDTDEPAKNNHSHIADAFQYLCCGIRWGGDMTKVAGMVTSGSRRLGEAYMPLWQTAGDGGAESMC